MEAKDGSMSWFLVTIIVGSNLILTAIHNEKMLKSVVKTFSGASFQKSFLNYDVNKKCLNKDNHHCPYPTLVGTTHMPELAPT